MPSAIQHGESVFVAWGLLFRRVGDEYAVRRATPAERARYARAAHGATREPLTSSPIQTRRHRRDDHR